MAEDITDVPDTGAEPSVPVPSWDDSVVPENDDQAQMQWLPKVMEEANKYTNPYDRDRFLQVATRNARAMSSIYLAQNRQVKLAQRGEIDKILGTPLQDTGTG